MLLWWSIEAFKKCLYCFNEYEECQNKSGRKKLTYLILTGNQIIVSILYIHYEIRFLSKLITFIII